MSEDDPMIEIRASFFVECEELLESLQDGLQIMDDEEADNETINVVFRAIHSIKGGAGAFGLEALVRFAHQFESVLDGVRSGTITADRDAISVFFQASDILADLVRSARDDTDADEDRTQIVLKSLETILGHDSNAVVEEEIDDFQPMGLVMDLGLDLEEDAPADPIDTPTTDASLFEDGYTIDFTPDSSLYVSGNEPLHLLRLLREMGQMTVTCDTSDLPSLAEIDVEKSYLSWVIHLTTDEDEDAVRDVFDFVADLCTLKINGPAGSSPTTPSPAPPRPPSSPPPSSPTTDDNMVNDAPVPATTSETSTAKASKLQADNIAVLPPPNPAQQFGWIWSASTGW